MPRTELLRMYAGTNVEGSDTELGEELCKSICNPQSDQPTQRLDYDRPGFTTLVTRARSYTLPNPMINQTNVKQGLSIQNVSRYEARDLLPSLQTIVGPDRKVKEFSHSPTSILIRIFTTRPCRVVIKIMNQVLLHGSNL